MITTAHVVAAVFEGQTIHKTTKDEAGIPVTACGKPVATLPDHQPLAVALRGLPSLPRSETATLPERNRKMQNLYGTTGEMFSGKPPFRYPKGSGIVLFVIAALGFFVAAGAFAKGGFATDCLLSLKEMNQKFKSMEERFTVYRCEWVVARFNSVDPKTGNEQGRWGEPWCRPTMDRVLGRGFSQPEASPEDIACMRMLMEAAHPE